MNKQLLFWAVVIGLIPALACGLFGGGDTESAASDVSFGQTEPTATPAPTEPAIVEDIEDVNAAEPAAESAQPETIAFSGITGLEQLDSYRIDFVMNFDGSSGGQPSVGRVAMVLESSTEPPARHLALEMEGSTVESTGGANRTEFYEIDNTIYLYNDAVGGSQWISMESDTASAEVFSQGFFAPDEDLELPDTVQCDAALETVNGVSTTHCTFTETDISSEEVTFDSLTGNVWISEEGYIVKYTVEAQGYQSLEQGEDLFEYGDVRLEYNLTEINGDLTITLPEEALNASSLDFGGGEQDSGETGAAAADSLPMLDNATEVFSVAGVTSYYTSSDIATVTDFYRQNLTAQGWIEDTDTAFSSAEAALLSFENSGRTLTIAISVEGEGRTNVNLVE